MVTEAEFPTIGHVWLAQERRGACVAWVPVENGMIELDAYDALIDDRTAVVSACHGYYMNGFTQDLAAVAARAHAHGALLYVDAYQTLGTLPVDVRSTDIDFLAAGNLKFLMGVPGVAFLYVRRELIDRLRPLVTGWFGRANPFAFQVKELDWSATASRFDAGTPPVANAYIARAGMEMINDIGVDRIRAWLEILGRRLMTAARAWTLRCMERRTCRGRRATTAFVVADSHRVEAAMRAAACCPSARGPSSVSAPHFYNTLSDVDTALDVLA